MSNQRMEENCKECRVEASMKTENRKKTKRERERTRKNSIPKTLTLNLYICVCSMHTFYTSPYKD